MTGRAIVHGWRPHQTAHCEIPSQLPRVNDKRQQPSTHREQRPQQNGFTGKQGSDIAQWNRQKEEAIAPGRLRHFCSLSLSLYFFRCSLYISRIAHAVEPRDV